MSIILTRKYYEPGDVQQLSHYVSQDNEAANVIKDIQGTLVGIVVTNSGDASFLQLFSSPIIPSNGALPHSILQIPAGSQQSFDYSTFNGLNFLDGIAFANSSTPNVLTTTSPTVFIEAYYI